MRIYSNKHLTVVERLELWKMVCFPRIGWKRHEIVFKVNSVSDNELAFNATNIYTMPPVGFVTQFVWEYPDKQIGVCNLDLKSYDICKFDKLYQQAIRLPEDVVEGDLVYVDTKQLVRYELV